MAKRIEEKFFKGVYDIIEYWANQEQKTKGLLASIVKNAQMLKEEEKPVVVVHKKKKERKTYKISDYLEGSKTNEWKDN